MQWRRCPDEPQLLDPRMGLSANVSVGASMCFDALNSFDALL